MAAFLSVIFKAPFKRFPENRQSYPYTPVLNVQIALPARNSPRSKRIEAFIDSGAARCVFHAEVGRAIGLDIETGVIENMTGVSGAKTPVYLHNISLYIPGDIVTIQAGFCDDLPVAGILGMAGFLNTSKLCLILSRTDANLSVFIEHRQNIIDVRRAGDLNPIAHETIPIYKIGSVT